MKKFFSGLIVLVCLVAFAGLAFAEKEKEEEGYDFVLINNSGRTFQSVYLSSAGKPNWNASRDKLKLKNGSLKSGESMEVKLPRERSASYLSKTKRRYWDIMFELPNGKRWTWRKLDLSKVYKIEITMKDGKQHLTYFTRKD